MRGSNGVTAHLFHLAEIILECGVVYFDAHGAEIVVFQIGEKGKPLQVEAK